MLADGFGEGTVMAYKSGLRSCHVIQFHGRPAAEKVRLRRMRGGGKVDYLVRITAYPASAEPVRPLKAGMTEIHLHNECAHVLAPRPVPQRIACCLVVRPIESSTSGVGLHAAEMLIVVGEKECCP